MKSADDRNSEGAEKSAPLNTLWTVIDRIGAGCAAISDVLVIAIALMLFGEVVARYLLNMPTIWTQDVAIALQLWFTYLAMAYVLRHREMIRITAMVSLLGPNARRCIDAFSLLVVIAFSLMAVYYATDIMLESIRLGRRAPTMLEMPNWISELPVIVGFALLALQGVADLVRIPYRPAPEFSAADEATE